MIIMYKRVHREDIEISTTSCMTVLQASERRLGRCMALRARVVSLFLVLILCILFTACSKAQENFGVESSKGNEETVQSTVDDGEGSVAATNEEVLTAIEYGLVPLELQKDYDVQISYGEFCELLDNLVKLYDDTYMDDWLSVSENYHDADDLMSRMEGALVLFYMAECTNLDEIGYMYNIPLGDLISSDVDFYENVTFDYPLLPDIFEIYYNETIASSENYSWLCENDYGDNATRFVERYSYVNGLTYFDYDEDYNLHLGDVFTREAAICAVKRLYETSWYTYYVDAEMFVCEMNEDAIVLAEKMADVTASELPDWNGYTLMTLDSNDYGAGYAYTEEIIALYADQGFNFVRVPVNFDYFFKNGDTSLVCEAVMRNLDELLEWCAKYNIHVCIDLHDMPGFTTDGDDSNDTMFFDADEQKLFVEFWTFMAEYFRNVPAELLSFNLINEPHGNYEIVLDENTYAAVMRSAIDVIHDVSPDRLIVVDMLNLTEPLYSLVDTDTVQSAHIYFLTADTDSWPTEYINGFVHRNSGELSIAGDFGSGTTLTLDIGGIHMTGDIVIFADGVEIARITLGGDEIGENGCIEIGEPKTDGEWFGYEGKTCTAVLNGDASVFSIVQEGESWWYSLNSITISTDTYFVKLMANNSVVSNEEVPHLTIDSNGDVSTDTDDTLCSIQDMVKRLADFSKETGVSVMVQELGFDAEIDYQTTLDAAEDLLSALDEFGIPWCSWNGEHGYLLDVRQVLRSEQMGGDILTRNSAEYESVGRYWIVDKGLQEVFQRHIQ